MRRVLLALAEHDDYSQAAAALGKAPHGFDTTLSLVRKQFLRLWQERETPSRVWGRDRRSTRRRLECTDYKKITVTTARRRRQKREKKQAEAGPAAPTDHPDGPCRCNPGAGCGPVVNN